MRPEPDSAIVFLILSLNSYILHETFFLTYSWTRCQVQSYSFTLSWFLSVHCFIRLINLQIILPRLRCTLEGRFRFSNSFTRL